MNNQTRLSEALWEVTLAARAMQRAEDTDMVKETIARLRAAVAHARFAHATEAEIAERMIEL